jgi:hypothetical protein
MTGPEVIAQLISTGLTFDVDILCNICHLGIKQKYSVLYPMLGETMKALNFSQTQIKMREYLGGERGEDDATGIIFK